ncbi:MAG: hypothetical protein ABIO94_08895 [Opitutaceae bacterium]
MHKVGHGQRRKFVVIRLAAFITLFLTIIFVTERTSGQTQSSRQFQASFPCSVQATLAASPEWHGRFHGTGNLGTDEGCAIGLFANGITPAACSITVEAPAEEQH